jgi:hypothetical protein
MKKILIAIGIVILLSGICLVALQKINEPYYQEQLFEEVATEAIHRTEPLQQIILIQEGKIVHIIVEPLWTKNYTFPINISVYTLKDFEGNRSHPLINDSYSEGTFFGSFTTNETTQYVFLLKAVYARYQVSTENVWSPMIWYIIGFCLILTGGIVFLLSILKKPKKHR